MARASRAKGVARARIARDKADARLREAIDAAIVEGVPDAKIAEAAGYSRQAIWRRRVEAAR